MAAATANLIALALGTYVVIGALFALAFQIRGLRRVDPAAAEGSLIFKLLITPGCIALWPVLAMSWRRGATASEHNAHRDRAAATGGSS